MIFSILYETEKDILKHIGTGFVVNKRGLILSAGHVIANHLNELDRLFAAFPLKNESSQLLRFKVLYHEYFFPLNAQTPIEIARKKNSNYEDLLIGRLFKYKPHEWLKIKRKRPLADEELISKGYLAQAGKSFPIKNGMVDLSQLDFRTQNSAIKNRSFSIISNYERDYNDNPDSVENIKKYNNCLMLKYPLDHGASGGPVLDKNGTVVGMVLGGKTELQYQNVLCSKYICKRYRRIK